MRLFDENSPREQVLWLLAHAIVLVMAGLVQALAAWSWLSDPRWKFRLDYFAAGAGGIIAAAAGVALLIVSVGRLRRPFAVLKMRYRITLLLAVEIILLFLSTLILDCGGIGSILARVFIILNILYLTSIGGTPASGEPPDDKSQISSSNLQ